MRFWSVTLTPLATFLFASTLLVSSFSRAADNPLTVASAATQTSPSTNSPTCTDLTNVQGPVIVFGFEGSYPYTIEIDSKGQINAYAPKSPGLLPPFPPPIPLNFGFERNNISPSTVKGVVRLATDETFWRLPEVIGQNSKDSNSKNLARFVTINLPCARKRVVVQDGTKTNPQLQQFAEVFMLLTDLIYDEPAGYKPLQ